MGALVAPAAMFPVSMLPSFRMMRCVTRSSFLKTTVLPAADAGLGENDCAPFWLTMATVTVFAGAGEGEGAGAGAGVAVVGDE